MATFNDHKLCSQAPGSGKQTRRLPAQGRLCCTLDPPTKKQSQGNRMSKTKKLLLQRAKRTSRAMTLSSKSDAEVAEMLFTGSSGFLQSPEWKALRDRAIAHYGGKCMCCGAVPKRGINVDHIKPRLYRPDLALSFDNLQILCGRCNKAKGNKRETDYRRLSHPAKVCLNGNRSASCNFQP